MSIRPTLVLSLVGLLVGAAAAQDFEARWRARVAEFRAENARLPAGSRTVVLLGSSSMEGWKQGQRVARFLPGVGPRTLNRGISGDGIGTGQGTGVRNRLDSSAFDCQPGHVVLLNGTNSLGEGVARVTSAYRDVVLRLRRGLPRTVIVLVTCQPTRGRYEHLAAKTVELNAGIRRIAAELGCRLIDLHPLLADADGLLMRPELTADGLHFGDAGYRLLGAAIERIVAEGGAPPPLPAEPDPRGGLVGGVGPGR